MASTRKTLVKAVNQKFPTLRLRDSEDFNGSTGGVWVNGTEDGITASDGFSLFDYYAMDSKEVRYVFGVHKELREVLEEHGWYSEWYDAGTAFFYEA